MACQTAKSRWPGLWGAWEDSGTVEGNRDAGEWVREVQGLFFGAVSLCGSLEPHYWLPIQMI